MRQERETQTRAFSKERKVDLLFAAGALVLAVVMIIVLVRWSGLRKQKNGMTEKYGSITEELVGAKQERTELEKEIEQARQELDELNRQIAALGGK